ncbi:cyclic nucleotide-binding domain-containing protein [[Mycobacterium] wendilense]|uniref:Cyclic nucleotide-binding domain-containing protein n=1 Tax=[Mycobacterium] wendilense TaxID=3064284 RepID=A0ABM9MCS2_9MYCO|nr:cyclic nucleotide-binding domain-containing protein [Mycolicibacterium sp. MU0050]CAJ1582059.1 cyclic nucleotide-binding domain-containing protein [Mycolicibacterium sp. MU0050]
MNASKGHEIDAQRLREFSTFANFSDSDLQRLLRAAHRNTRSSPWPLILEQTPSDACFILLSGEAGVYVGRTQVATVGPGEVIGESALRQGQLRNATVTTTGPAEILRIDKAELTRLLDEIPALREAVDATAERHSPESDTAGPS